MWDKAGIWLTPASGSGASAGSPCAPEEVPNGRDVPTPAAGGPHASAVQGGGNSAQRLQPRGPKLLHDRQHVRGEAVGLRGQGAAAQGARFVEVARVPEPLWPSWPRVRGGFARISPA